MTGFRRRLTHVRDTLAWKVARERRRAQRPPPTRDDLVKASLGRVLSAWACVRRWSLPAKRGEFPTRADLEVIDVARGVVPQDDWNDARYVGARVADRQTRVCIGTLRDFRIFELVQRAERRRAAAVGEQPEFG